MQYFIVALISTSVLVFFYIILNQVGNRRKSRLKNEKCVLATWHAPIVKWCGLFCSVFFATVTSWVFLYLDSVNLFVWFIAAIPIVFFSMGVYLLLQGTLEVVELTTGNLCYRGILKGGCMDLIDSTIQVVETMAASGGKKMLVFYSDKRKKIILHSTLEKYDAIRAVLIEKHLLGNPVELTK